MRIMNELYPIFLKVAQLEVLIVGGGKVALEKLTFLLKSSPNAKVHIVAPQLKGEVIALVQKHQINLINQNYSKEFLEDKHLVISATNDTKINKQVYLDCKERNLLINVADTPKLCDFYLGGIVTKGHVKIAISTNGKSPTMAKRLRQFFEEIIPEDVNQLVENLHQFRKTIKGNFEKKVSTLNELTENLIKK